MPINAGLAHLSNGLLLTAVVIYAVAMLAFACDFAFGKKRAPAVARARVRELVSAKAAAGAADSAVGGPVAEADDGLAGEPLADGPGAGGSGPVGAGVGAAESVRRAGRGPVGFWVTTAVVLTCIGLALHSAGVLTRGLAVHRLPWGDMYEFVTALTCVAVAFFLGAMVRYRAYYMGLFVMASVVLVLGLAETVIYTPAGELPPALQSYWLAIHVTAMTLATGIFFVAAVTGVTYLVVDRHARRVAAGRPAGADGILRRLPGPAELDRLAYRTIVFGFPVWTFGVMAGAIWADYAWGSYWSWDPTETWAFITWVAYACFLHARATAGWRGRRAAVIQLTAFCCLLFNVLVVSLIIPGQHSYAGLH
ncbi:MAG TPA: c-type cytochrome biogenesis protein CcsB [Streptosporangiaceae bacterium]|nr:c-type cytochrome biogenesis protein CcsB [Streptosporangiaceae bacterium]